MLAKKYADQPLRSIAQLMDEDWLRAAHQDTRTDAAVGVDGVTAEAYAADLEENLRSLWDRARSGRYRAPPTRRVHIPKGDGRKTRPLGIPTYEDKILQRSVKMALEPVWEAVFYDFSFGFRPGRSQHDALAYLREGLNQLGGGWALDVDVSNFFDTLDHQALREIFRSRVVDGVLVRLVGKWLRAGVLEDGVIRRTKSGTPQGGPISPLLANIYLHEVLDRWWSEDVLPRMRGRAFLVRYADDFIIVFERKQDALRVQEVLPKRFGRFGLSLHPEKTRLVRFRRPGRHAKKRERGATFNFLGFTHYWARSLRGWGWMLLRKTATKRLSRALTRVDQWCRRCRHLPIREQAKALNRKLNGHYNYYGISGNSKGIKKFFWEVLRIWKKWLSRRSHKAWIPWERFRHLERLLARPRLRPRPAKR